MSVWGQSWKEQGSDHGAARGQAASGLGDQEASASMSVNKERKNGRLSSARRTRTARTAEMEADRRVRNGIQNKPIQISLRRLLTPVTGKTREGGAEIET